MYCFCAKQHKINICKTNDNTYELKSCLNDTQGQWLTKTDDDLYIGIEEKGISEKSLNEWFKSYAEKVNQKIEKIKIKINIEEDNKLSLYNKSLAGILSINIKKYGLMLSLYKYNMLGEVSEIKKYIHK